MAIHSSNADYDTDLPVIPEYDMQILGPASLFAMIMTALADGDLNQREKNTIIFVFYFGHRRYMSPQKALTQLQELVDGVSFIPKEYREEYWMKILEPARKLSGRSKIEILHACVKTAIIDGPMSPVEEQMFESIMSWIAIEPQDLAIWQTEYNHAVKEMNS